MRIISMEAVLACLKLRAEFCTGLACGPRTETPLACRVRTWEAGRTGRPFVTGKGWPRLFETEV